MRTFLRKIRQFILWKVTLLRGCYWSVLFGKLGKKTIISGRITVLSPENVTIGTQCTINEGVMINALAPVTIGDFVRISPGVIINAGGLDYEAPAQQRGHVASEVVIEDGVWICSGAIINPGVRIKKNSVIGAGAVVTKDIPENTLAFGIPAEPKKTIGIS